jgi:hypothetical protein
MDVPRVLRVFSCPRRVRTEHLLFAGSGAFHFIPTKPIGIGILGSKL